MTAIRTQPVLRRREPLTGMGPRRAWVPWHDRPLSPRELEVVELICELDLTNAEIAERMFVCQKTVEMHITDIRAKRELPNGRVRRGAAWRAVFRAAGDAE